MTKSRIVLIPFPFDDLSGVKIRPALCLTNPMGPYRHVVAAFVSSKIPSSSIVTDVLIDVQHPDFAATGLKVSSVIRLHRLMTFPTSIIRRDMGKISAFLQIEVDRKLMSLFGLGTCG